MAFDLRVEYLREDHVDSYASLSRAEYGDHAAVSRPDHLRWKFLENPQGKTMGVHLYRDGELVGRMVALARKFVYRGREYSAAHIVDFLVHPGARGMSALMQLASGLKKLEGFDFLLIMAPNPAGAAVWEKFVKMRGYFDLQVATIPLRPLAMLQGMGKLRSGRWRGGFDWPWRLAVGAAARIGTYSRHIQVETKWPEKEELDALFASDWGDKVVGLRSAEYLDWRYRKGPVFHYGARFLRVRGQLAGYIVTRRAKFNDTDCLFIVDAYGKPSLGVSDWRAASMAEVAQAAAEKTEMALLMGNTLWGPMGSLSAFPFVKVPPRLLPRKTTVYAQWVTAPAFEVNSECFYCALGDSDVI